MISTSGSGRSPAGQRRYRLVSKLVWGSLVAAVGIGVAVGSIAELAGTAEAAAVTAGASKPMGPTLGWQLSHPFCANCTAAFGQNQWIDPAGSLQPGSVLQIRVKGTLQGQPAAGATVFLSDQLIGRGATATVAGVPLTATPQPFQLNAKGKLVVTYRVADTQPGPFGTDVITAADTAAGGRAVTASYDYDSPASYTLSPVPVAPPGTLAAGQSAPAQLIAIDAAGSVVGGAFVSDSEDNYCGTWWHVGPHHDGPQVGSASDPTYAFTNAAGQLNFSFVSNGGTGGTNVLTVTGAASQSGPGATTLYQC
jgi:hypothetical protein